MSTPATSPGRRPTDRRAGTGAAVALLVVGVLLLALSRLVAHHEAHAYGGAAAPGTVRLSAGAQYAISVRGGVDALRARGGQPSRPDCSYALTQSPDAARQTLTVAPVGSDDRSVNVVATFVSPVTGAVRISCLGWNPVYVDDSDDSGTLGGLDLALILVLLSSLALTAGAILLLSALYRRGPAASPRFQPQDSRERSASSMLE